MSRYHFPACCTATAASAASRSSFRAPRSGETGSAAPPPDPTSTTRAQFFRPRDWPCSRWDAGSLPKDDREGWLDANLSAALTAASQEHSLALLAGRSLGTWALARAVSKSDWKAHPLPTVWLAPLLNHPPVLNALKELRAPAFVVGGSSDEAFDLTEAELLKKSGADVIVLDGADHGLEVDNPAASARHLADVLDEMRGFVNRATSSATLK
jgi:pimeloyl-ACP methyl ester carboxylesterase